MSYSIFFFLLVTIYPIAANSPDGNGLDFSENNNDPHQYGCHCVNYTCGCCEPINLIELHGIVCTNFSYLPNDYGVSLTITYNNYTLYNETISARNPPPICVGIPEFEKISAEVCVTFYDLTFKLHHFHCCSNLRIAVYHYIHRTIELGCFNIPSSKTKFPIQSSSIKQSNYPTVIYV
ncbi:uncharacterized protein LOC103579874 [Microplitis demolitor]|uniref:uncharacterized protein LOC103579874 n=1 Tax=Microplitis demolitor TaxID=69319 RepID=UPI0004CCAEA4|nr:uncharacterized protein LOC103579874 [Microplitis demolitor]